MSPITAEIKARSEVYQEHGPCQVKSTGLLKEMALPDGVLPLKDIEECGYDRETGFVWLKQKENSTHEFEKLGYPVSYAAEVTAHVEHGKIENLTGVGVMKLSRWVSVTGIYVDEPGKVTFKTPDGLCGPFPVSAFDTQ